LVTLTLTDDVLVSADVLQVNVIWREELSENENVAGDTKSVLVATDPFKLNEAPEIPPLGTVPIEQVSPTVSPVLYLNLNVFVSVDEANVT
jgi:hypothetical protein